MNTTQKKTITESRITTTPSWHRLLEAGPERSTYRIIRRLQFRELGYLHLLEKVITPFHFRTLCPLVVPISTNLANYVISQVPEASLKPLLQKQHQSKLLRLLWHYYCRLQLHTAQQYWPTDIWKSLDTFLDQIVIKQTSITPREWHLCQLYLDTTYGLSGSPPVNNEKEIFDTVLKRAKINPDKFVNRAAVQQWTSQTHSILTSPAVLAHLKDITRVFHRRHRAKWTRLLVPSSLAEEHFGPSLDSSLQDLLSQGAANTLEKKGIYTVGDLEGITAEFIKSIPNCGDATVAEIKSVLLQVKKAIDRRASAEQDNLKTQYKLARQLEKKRRAKLT